MTMFSHQFVILFVLAFDKPNHVRTEENKSFFTILRTRKASPMNIEDSCFDIDQESVNIMYLGISIFLNNRTSCKPENIGLKEVQKYIIHDKHQRKLCRTKLTVSINNCEKSIEELKHICQHPDEKLSIFFQDCLVHSFPENNETITEAGAIVVSAFPKPKLGERRHPYKVPKVQCNMKVCELKKCVSNKVQERSSPPLEDFPYLDSKERHTLRVLNQMIIIVGCVGLIVGIFSTSFVCMCMHKHNRSRFLDNDLFSKLNINNRTETERKFSIYSHDEEVVYHDIVDMKDQVLNTDIQHVVSNVFRHYHDSTEQRYSESPRSSISTYENECIEPQWSIQKAPKEYISRNEPSNTYHKLLNHNKIGLSSKQDEGLFQTETVDTEDTMIKKTSIQTKHSEQDAEYEVPVRMSNATKPRDDKSDISAVSAFCGQNEGLTSPVYRVLPKKAGKHPAIRVYQECQSN